MDLWVLILLIAAAVAVSASAMLVARGLAPAGGFFVNPNRVGGVFSVLGSSFAVLLAFVILSALTSYRDAKDKAGQEAIAVTQLYVTAGLFSPPTAGVLRGDLECYGRAVADDEWRTMRRQQTSPLVESWLTRMGSRLARLEPAGQREAVAYQQWFNQDAVRREGRRGRLAEAAPFVPTPLRLVLALGATLVIGFVLLLADPAEPFVPQAILIGAITVLMVSGLLIVQVLDRPYENASGSIRPVEMGRTLALMDQARLVGRPPPLPCDAAGRPTT